MKEKIGKKKNISIHAPMKGATNKVIVLDSKFPISIHAPMKGATVEDVIKNFTVLISIHAPMKGATRMSSNIADMKNYFNPRSHEGSDIFFLYFQKLHYYFNPRSHEGSDIQPLVLR